MAEIVVPIEATNLFNLGAYFHTRASTSTPFKTFNLVLGATGDRACSQEYDTGINYNQVAGYCNSSPNIVTDLGTFLTTLGAVQNSILPTSIQIEFAAGVAAIVTIDGHQHDTNPHTTGLQTWNVSDVIPASSGIGVPTLITVTGDVSPTRATVTFSFDHKDVPGATGVHFAGENITGKCTISIDYIGQPASVTAGDWLNIIQTNSDSNMDQDTANITAEQYFTAS